MDGIGVTALAVFGDPWRRAAAQISWRIALAIDAEWMYG